MKEFAASVVKEFRHIFRDRRTILIAMVMPVVQIILFGFAVSTEVNDVRVVFCGDLSDAEVRRAVDRIDQNKYLRIVGRLDRPAEAEEMFRKNGADVAVCFERNYGSRMVASGHAGVRIIGDGSDPNTAQMIASYLKGVLQSEQSDVSVALAGDPRSSMTPVVQLMYNPAMKSSYNFVPGVMGLILMLICSMMTAVSIVREKETGTLELLLVSPVKPLWIIVSKMIPYLVLSAANFVSILLLSHYVMEVPVNGSLLLLSLAALIFVVTSLALGLLISVISSSQRTALLICGMGLTMPTMIFSGIIFPCESMPVILQWFSDIIPAKWFIIIVKKVMIQGDGLASVINELSSRHGGHPAGGEYKKFPDEAAVTSGEEVVRTGFRTGLQEEPQN